MKKALFAVIMFGAVLLLPAVARAVDTLDPARLGLIQEHCTVLQTTLDQVQRRDLVARTNRGREYESIIAQQAALSQRLRNNDKSSQALDAITTRFNGHVDAFRANYVTYDNEMNSLRQIDCRNKPADFALALQRTAILRAQVGAEVTRGDEDLVAYRALVVELQAGLRTGPTQ